MYSSVGHGGASAYLAVMALAGLAPTVMRPAALVLNLIVAAIGSIRFARAGHFRWRLFWPFAVTSIPLAFVGGAITLPDAVYRRILAVVLLFAAYRLWRVFRGGEEKIRLPPLPAALVWGAAIGLLSGLTGVGGGIFLSPLLLLAHWAEPKPTAAVSAAFIWVNSFAGLLGKPSSLAVLPEGIALWAAAAAIGGILGAGLGSRRLPSLTLRRLLAVVLLIAGG
ncbi:MAG TPA: sulfite exporter TauE/SafE family protein, partial [Thermoanaerobaculia bacterium]|nr:sulfite exporter TauE/SafE family protein [Thermoanaerobaculia bacterium]